MDYPQLDLENATGTKVTLKTSMGDIEIQLFDEIVPKTVKNFVELAQKNYYDGVKFHRVVQDFIIQSGDPTGTGMGGESIYGEEFEDEFSEQLYNLKGALSMANSGPDSNTSQFFIITNNKLPKEMISTIDDVGFPTEIVKQYRKGGAPWLDMHHTVFGQVAKGMNVVRKINKVACDEEEHPVEDIIIEKVIVK